MNTDKANSSSLVLSLISSVFIRGHLCLGGLSDQLDIKMYVDVVA